MIRGDPLPDAGAEHTPLNIGGAKVHTTVNAREEHFLQYVIRSAVLTHRSGDRAAEAEWIFLIPKCAFNAAIEAELPHMCADGYSG